ncbi:MAG: virulence-associated E family protein [Parerythrobacter sp.]
MTVNSEAATAAQATLAITYFERANVAQGTRCNLTWPQLVAWLQRPDLRAPSKAELPLIKLATFAGDRRSDAMLEQVCGIEGDYDAGQVQPAIAAARLADAGIGGLIYTTPSHRPGVSRWRVLCPLSQPIAPAERHAMGGRLNGAMGGVLAPETFVASQAFYVGAVDGGEPVQCFVVGGAYIDTVDGIEPIGPPQSSGDRQPLGSLPTVAREHVEAALDEIDPNELDRETWRNITAGYRGAGGGREPWDRWCARYEGNSLADNEKLWRSLEAGTALGWDYLRRHAPVAAARAAFGTPGKMPIAATVKSEPMALPPPGGTTGGPSLLDVVQTVRDWNLPVALDEFADRYVVTGPLPFERASAAYPRPLRDADYSTVQIAFNATGQKVSKDALRDGVDYVARMNAINPVTDWLNALQWDGATRLGRWLVDYMGAEPEAWCELIGPKFIIGMVARAFQPGCKMDNALVLEGPQGIAKSTALRVLAGESYFGDQLPNMRDKEALQFIAGLWLVEIGELAALNRSEVEDVKQFLTARVDRYRPSYGRLAVDRPRSTVFAATTNQTDYLKDSTGNRRWWPVRCGMIDVERLRQDREQLFAEAVARYRAGERWWLTSDEEARAAVEQSERTECDPWYDTVNAYCAANIGKMPITMAGILRRLGYNEDRLNSQITRRVAAILRREGFEQRRMAGSGARYYAKP